MTEVVVVEYSIGKLKYHVQPRTPKEQHYKVLRTQISEITVYSQTVEVNVSFPLQWMAELPNFDKQLVNL